MDENDERQPILSNETTRIQSDGGGYGASVITRNSSSNTLLSAAAQDGTLASRTAVRLKTDVRRDPTVVRKPFVYKPITNGDARAADTDDDQRHAEEDRRRGFARRLHYFHRLDRRPDSTFAMPDHVVPEDFWVRILGPVENKHNSVVTIFSLWNTMMGTSLLSMPWAIEQAGFVGGIVLLIVMAFIMFYTSYLVLKSVHLVPGLKFTEFSEVCGHFLGKYSSSLATFSSLVTLLGGMIVYWILLSNFLFRIVKYVYNEVNPDPFHNITNISGVGIVGSDMYSAISNSSDVICKGYDIPTDNTTTSSIFEKVWTEDLTVPILLAVLLFGLVNFKSATLFTKLNSLGVVSVVYLLAFTCIKSGKWGVNLDLGSADAPYFKLTFPALTGICALAYFVQNCVIAITRNNRHPENNVRDLSIAFFLVAFCYIFVGTMIFITFPLSKNCIEDNFLNNMRSDDVLTFFAHILLFFQMSCVFPLLTFILRSQLFLAVFGTVWPSLKHVLALTVVLFSICVVFAIFLPHIGRIIGFVGAFCGLAYAIALPCGVTIQAQRKNNTLTWSSLIFHSILIIIGFVNFIAQFLIIGKTS